MKYKKLKINTLRPNEYNPNEMTESILNHLVAELKRIGFLQPILVNKKGIIIDGEHRWLAAQEAGLKEVPVIEVDMSEKEAKLTTVNMNQIKGDLNPLKFAELLIDLRKDFQLEDLSETFNMSMGELENYDVLLNLPNADLEDTEKKPKTITCPECNHEFEI